MHVLNNNIIFSLRLRLIRYRLRIAHPITYLSIIILPIIFQIFVFYFTNQSYLSKTIVGISILEMVLIPLIYLYNFAKSLVRLSRLEYIRHSIKNIIYNLYFHLLASYGLFVAGSVALIDSFNPKYYYLLRMFSNNPYPEGLEKIFLLIYSIFLLISLLFSFQFGYNHFSYKINH